MFSSGFADLTSAASLALAGALLSVVKFSCGYGMACSSKKKAGPPAVFLR